MQLINAHVQIGEGDPRRVITGDPGESPYLLFGTLVFSASSQKAADDFAAAAVAYAQAFTDHPETPAERGGRS